MNNNLSSGQFNINQLILLIEKAQDALQYGDAPSNDQLTRLALDESADSDTESDDTEDDAPKRQTDEVQQPEA